MQAKIVVIDDERIILELTSMVLTSRGFEVHLAEDAIAGLELVEKLRPEVVLLDYMMPKMDGLTALKHIRREFPETYVIMFTGKGSEEVAVELMKAGASDYILKPFSNQNLVERIETVLRLRRIELHNLELMHERERLLREVEEWNLELERRVLEKSRELERAHAEILQAEKLAALGHLAAGMAHEIRNPLNSISLFTQVLRSAVAEDAEMSSYADKILGEVERIDQLLVKLLGVSRQPKGDPVDIHLHRLIKRVLESFDEQIRRQGIEVEADLPAVPAIRGDEDEVEQIFTNLVSNAVHEMADGGHLRLALRQVDGRIDIEVADSGGGIPQEHLSQIFDPFFTTKERGTGFGLSVVLRIVKSMGGKVRVESTPGQGATFFVSLPTKG
ncbi:phospho-acceptor domain-containing protein [Geothermobacter ehrlichii]|uniref:histidine kinase n=1 Tax=Geothermobacter ehrlichii TaxID=213224 RepID=A0A5D3WIQ9_9BACT|nr:response regulator [Geothermobacter ehrlichii]TYO98822.1 phospho-acceptor domain-containing protein [Geothermobacter ehrlichii]